MTNPFIGENDMGDISDHDLLVRLDAKLEMVLQSQAAFIQTSTTTSKELAERVAKLEVKDRGDSEKVQAITADVQRSLNNSARISDAFQSIDSLRIDLATLKVEKQNLQEEIAELKKKSNLFDVLNAIGFTASGIIGFIFGKK